MLNDEILVARWQDLRDLYHQERDRLVKMSMLNEVAVYPRVIERQRVQSCLNVFCGKTAASLQLYEEKCEKDVNGKVILIQTVCKWWKKLNVKQKGLYMRFRDPLQAVISDPNDARLEFVQNFEIMCFKMAGKQGNRVRQQGNLHQQSTMLVWV